MEGVTAADYKFMCDIILNYCNENVSSDKLKAIKITYEDQINSNRRLESIQNMADLISVLEKRDCLSHKDVTVLHEIADNLNIKNMLNFRNKERSEKPKTETFNGCRYENRQFISTETNQDLVKRKIYKAITEELGKSWIDFARALNYRECDIDELKIKHPTNPKLCTVSILEYHETEAHQRVWKSQLLGALRKARRNDLYNKVTNIFDDYS